MLTCRMALTPWCSLVQVPVKHGKADLTLYRAAGKQVRNLAACVKRHWALHAGKPDNYSCPECSCQWHMVLLMWSVLYAV